MLFRSAPALQIGKSLLERGAKVRVHDPIALSRAKAEVGSSFDYCQTVAAVAEGADALVLATEWAEYQALPWQELARSMRSAIFLDGRNALPRATLEGAGFRYIGVGR